MERGGREWEEGMGEGREGVGGGCGWEESSECKWGGEGKYDVLCMCEGVRFLFVNLISLYQSTAASTS